LSTQLIDFSWLTDNNQYFPDLTAFYKHQPVCSLISQKNDDRLWVVLTYLRGAAYAAAHEKQYVKRFLSRAKFFYNLAKCGWDNTTCGGGMYWGQCTNYKNAVTTELFITASMGMYEAFKEESYLQSAIRGWVWFKSIGLINQQGLVNDGLDNTCKFRSLKSRSDIGTTVRQPGLTTKASFSRASPNCTNTLEIKTFSRPRKT
jgi:Glycosyl hydrolase family 76